MKKIIISIIGLVIATNIFSQKISGGLFFAPGISWFSIESKLLDNNGTKMNYSFGATIDFSIVDNFAFSTGLSFNNYRGNILYKYGATDIKPDESDVMDLPSGSIIKYNLDYIMIPLGFKGKSKEIGYMTYFLKMGLDPMFNIKAKAKIGDFEDYIGKEIRLFHLGWHIGGGFELTLAGNTRLLIELLYTGGLTDFDKTTVYNSSERTGTADPRSRLHDVSLKFGILF